MVYGNIQNILIALLKRLPANKIKSDNQWQQLFKDAAVKIENARETIIQEHFTEASISAKVADFLPAKTTLITGNSMSIRDLACFSNGTKAKTFHQRGLAGIDGLISGAAGTASLLEEPVFLLLGDISAFHDINGLALLQHIKKPVIIIIINNFGGRIFEQLPLGRIDKFKESLATGFIATQTISFEQIALSFKIKYQKVTTALELGSAISASLNFTKPGIIEAEIDIQNTEGWRDKFCNYLN